MPEVGSATELLRPQYGDHLVQFHEDDASLTERVAAFLGAGLADGGVAIAIMTGARFKGMCERLSARGHALGRAMRARELVFIDAEKALERLLMDGQPDEIRFKELVRPLIEEGLQSSTLGRVRVYGEIVQLLAAEGRFDEALTLEGFWERLLRRYPFSLYCGYLEETFTRPGVNGARDAVHAAHTHLIVS